MQADNSRLRDLLKLAEEDGADLRLELHLLQTRLELAESRAEEGARQVAELNAHLSAVRDASALELNDDVVHLEVDRLEKEAAGSYAKVRSVRLHDALLHACAHASTPIMHA